MDEAQEDRSNAVYTVDPEQVAKMPEDLKRRWQELVVFWEAGVISDAELEEQMVKLRWSLL